MQRTVVVDCFPESIQLYREGYAVVAVDVIRATTSAVTAVALGRRCFAVSSPEAAFALAAKLDNPLLVGELGGDMPEGFDMNNSPSMLARRTDLARPMILLSSSGSKLIEAAGQCEAGYLACFRDYVAVANYVLRHPKVAVIGARSRGEFREEDQMCCAWIAGRLLAEGYQSANPQTANLVEHWHNVSASACASGHSAQYLKDSGQTEDLDFVLTRINDLRAVCTVRDGEVVVATSESSEDQTLPVPATGAGARPIVSA